MQEACGRAGGPQVTLPLVPGLGSEHQLSFWGEENHSEATEEGSGQRCGDKQESCALYSPPCPHCHPHRGEIRW